MVSNSLAVIHRPLKLKGVKRNKISFLWLIITVFSLLILFRVKETTLLFTVFSNHVPVVLDILLPSTFIDFVYFLGRYEGFLNSLSFYDTVQRDDLSSLVVSTAQRFDYSAPATKASNLLVYDFFTSQLFFFQLAALSVPCAILSFFSNASHILHVLLYDLNDFLLYPTIEKTVSIFNKYFYSYVYWLNPFYWWILWQFYVDIPVLIEGVLSYYIILFYNEYLHDSIVFPLIKTLTYLGGFLFNFLAWCTTKITSLSLLAVLPVEVIYLFSLKFKKLSVLLGGATAPLNYFFPFVIPYILVTNFLFPATLITYFFFKSVGYTAFFLLLEYFLQLVTLLSVYFAGITHKILTVFLTVYNTDQHLFALLSSSLLIFFLFGIAVLGLIVICLVRITTILLFFLYFTLNRRISFIFSFLLLKSTLYYTLIETFIKTGKNLGLMRFKVITHGFTLINLKNFSSFRELKSFFKYERAHVRFKKVRLDFFIFLVTFFLIAALHNPFVFIKTFWDGLSFHIMTFLPSLQFLQDLVEREEFEESVTNVEIVDIDDYFFLMGGVFPIYSEEFSYSSKFEYFTYSLWLLDSYKLIFFWFFTILLLLIAICNSVYIDTRLATALIITIFMMQICIVYGPMLLYFTPLNEHLIISELQRFEDVLLEDEAVQNPSLVYYTIELEYVDDLYDRHPWLQDDICDLYDEFLRKKKFVRFMKPVFNYLADRFASSQTY